MDKFVRHDKFLFVIFLKKFPACHNRYNFIIFKLPIFI
ncbi:hypothetical protein SPAB_05079 [Salmonella enterica subsp. enterica serovar Paratyphi B str. SPB7]|uniref:Uncharacterized protein n=1 Tax=Salmonella paratyphi B (strain ATCC BAA-1250 / SPB7) TaxID=1016998 RepID=A0A6C6Z8I6_SALPB|nr:hypothetical protein SPAB_05079 [Salmonella enterica subsp. enterica serovar Paratyphi B str. SPB7]